jgi:hypothetical protein
MPNQIQNPETMINIKAQMTNKVQNPNGKGEQVWPLACPPNKFFGRRGIWISIDI